MHEDLNPTRREQIAWAAGLFDGEGSIHVRHNGVSLQLGMTDRDLIERFRSVVGAGGICTRTHLRTKPLHTWHLGKRAEVQRVLNDLLPWFGERRGERAQEGLSFIATFYRECSRTGCNIVFLAGRTDRVYCTEACYTRAHREQARLRARAAYGVA
jgi:hypothetical protein